MTPQLTVNADSTRVREIFSVTPEDSSLRICGRWKRNRKTVKGVREGMVSGKTKLYADIFGISIRDASSS